MKGLVLESPAVGGGVRLTPFRPFALLGAMLWGQPDLHSLCPGSARPCLSLGVTPSFLRDPVFPTSAFTASLGPAFWKLPSQPQPFVQAVVEPWLVHKPLTFLPGGT